MRIYIVFSPTGVELFCGIVNDTLSCLAFVIFFSVLPLLFKYRFSNLDSKVLPYIELGATFDIKVSGKMDIIENYGGKDTVLPLQAARLAVGPEFGVGLEQKLNERNTLYYGIRGGYYFGGASTDKREFRSNVSINCSISF